MGAAFFYHLTRGTVEETLGLLAEKSLGAGWRVEVRGRSPQLLERLDGALWHRRGFLPHGIAGGPHDSEQPILLTTGSGGNNASCVMCLEGVDIAPEDITSADRVCILFDGHDGEAVNRARAQWKVIKDAGVEAQYWSEESGSWQKKASANDSAA